MAGKPRKMRSLHTRLIRGGMKSALESTLHVGRQSLAESRNQSFTWSPKRWCCRMHGPSIRCALSQQTPNQGLETGSSMATLRNLGEWKWWHFPKMWHQSKWRCWLKDICCHLMFRFSARKWGGHSKWRSKKEFTRTLGRMDDHSHHNLFWYTTILALKLRNLDYGSSDAALPPRLPKQGIPQNWRNFHPARLPKFLAVLAFELLSRRASTVGDVRKQAGRALPSLRQHKTFILTFMATLKPSFWPRSASSSPVQWAPSCSHTAIKKAKMWPLQGKISYSWGHIAVLWHCPGLSSLVT